MRGDIRKSRCTTGIIDINDTGCQFCHQFRLCCWCRCQQHRRQFATGINDTRGKFATVVNDRWQIMGAISGCWDLKVNLKAKIYIYVNSTTQRCSNKIIKIFEDFSHLPPVPKTPMVHLELRCEYLREFSKKFETALMIYSGAWGKLIHEKNQKSKISWHCPFKKKKAVKADFQEV